MTFRAGRAAAVVAMLAGALVGSMAAAETPPDGVLDGVPDPAPERGQDALAAPPSSEPTVRPVRRKRQRGKARPDGDGTANEARSSDDEPRGAYSIIARGDEATLIAPGGAPPPVPAVSVAAAPDPPSPVVVLQIAGLDRRIAELEAREVALKRELETIAPGVAQARAKAIADGRAYYRLTRAGLLPLASGFDALVRHAMRVERTRRAVAATLTRERRLEERGAELTRELERIAHDRAALLGQRDALASVRGGTDDEARRQAAFDKAFRTSRGTPGSDYVAVYGGTATKDDAPSSGFAASRGRLLFPVVGHAETRPARRDGASGPGLEIHAPLGSAVRAVFAGRVAFADRYGAYGRIVILDHGDHFYTVSGNLSSIDVKVGDEVSAGERLGSVGDEGKGPLLYFEVRRGTETLSPAAWLGT